jgi:hypothetical protein
MDFILSVPEKRIALLKELLRNNPFLKARPISKEKAERVNDMLDAIQELKDIEAGKSKPRSMKALLREL